MQLRGGFEVCPPRSTPAGSYAEQMAVAERLLAPMPDQLSYEQAAAVPLAAQTAWQVRLLA